MPVSYPPYVNAYGNLQKLFDAIQQASVPSKFTLDYINTILNLKSSSYRAMIPYMKKLGFIDQANVPTQLYKDYRDTSSSKIIMAKAIKNAYPDIFASSEYAYKLSQSDLTSKLKTQTGAANNDKIIPCVVGSFMALCKLANFDSKEQPIKNPDTKLEISSAEVENKPLGAKIGLSYTINLNLPATTEIDVFNSIFKSLKEHILDAK
ncbi:MAG: DUF5343 domain-containing protein [Bacteroidales bacterium]|jgi:hypothetical protein|nr:DUF5343 domain-containing protein [Bacteroidales bacterium]